MRKFLLAIVHCFLMVMVTSCGGSSSNSNNSGSLQQLSIVAPEQYPAGFATTVFMVVNNNGNLAVSNLLYTIPDSTNYTGTNLYIDPSSAKTCSTIAANGSCTLKVKIGINSKPGSFNVVASNSTQSSFVTQSKSLFKVNGTAVLTTNIGLTSVPSNTASGANGISFLYPPTVELESSGDTQVSLVALVNQNAGNNFNTINLTTSTGSLLNFSAISGNSGNGLTNLSAGSIVTFILKIPAGTTSSYSFYAQTMENGSPVSLGTTENKIVIAPVGHGVLLVKPTEFSLSQDYATQILTYSNAGTATINDISVTTPTAPVYITQNDCANISLSPGENCNVSISLSNPLANGSGSILASSSAGNAVSQYNYTGSAAQNGISLTAVNNFIFTTSTDVGSVTTKVTLKNTGNVIESNFMLSFSPNSYFSISQENGDTCIVSNETIINTLQNGESCVFTMKYSNSNYAVGLTTLNIDYNYSAANLSGSDSKILAYQTINGGANLGVSPDAYNFGGILANNIESKEQMFTLTNSGATSISSIDFQNLTGDSIYFSVESNVNGGCATAMPLANGQSCSFGVTFGPTATVNNLIAATLNVKYFFAANESSITTVPLGGYSRSALSANIFITNVASNAVIGNGESAATAFEIESDNVNSSTITLTYKNTSTTNATNFTVSQAPSGYSIATNNCNSVTLQANSANSCTVVLQPTANAAGALNIIFNNNSLSGSWSDEAGTMSNQTILWNNNGNTQSTVYTNIFAAPVVAAVISSDTAGTLPITQIGASGSFYVVLTLTGGYNVNTSYTVTAPNGFTPTTASCIITSSNPQCNVAITAPSSAVSGASISLSGGIAPTIPSSLSINVISPPSTTMYAYMSTGTTGIFQCTVLESGALDNCVKSVNPNGTSGTIVSLAMYPTGDYLYALTNTGTLPTDVGSYYACDLSGSGGIYESTNCGQKNFPAYGNVAFVPTQDTMYAYLAGQPAASNGNQPAYCTISQESSLFCSPRSSYPTLTSRALASMVVNGSSYVYISSVSDSSIYSCDVTNNAGYISPNCPNAAPASRAMKIPAISTLQIGNAYYAYVIDNNGPDLKVCQIESSGVRKGLFFNDGSDDCPLADPNLYTTVSSTTRISTAIVNDQPYLYLFGDVSGEISICPLSSNPADVGTIIGYYDPIQGNYCATFSLGTAPYISTAVGSMVFGSF